MTTYGISETGTTINVCVDCLMVAANGETEGTPDREPLGLVGDREVTTGCLVHEFDADEQQSECRDEHGYSWSPCQGCGSKLGGDRYPLTYWTPGE